MQQQEPKLAAQYSVGQRFQFAPGQAVVCNGHPGTVVSMYSEGMVEVRLPGGLVCVCASFPDCYPRSAEASPQPERQPDADDVFGNVLVAAQNAHDYLSLKVGDARLIDSERKLIAEVLAGLGDQINALNNGQHPSGALLYEQVKRAHVVTLDLFATTSTSDGRNGVKVVNDLRVAITILVHGAKYAQSSLPIKRRVMGDERKASQVQLDFVIADNAEVPRIGICVDDTDRSTLVEFDLPVDEEQRDSLELLIIGTVNAANVQPHYSLAEALTAASGHLASRRVGDAMSEMEKLVHTALVTAAQQCFERGI